MGGGGGGGEKAIAIAMYEKEYGGCGECVHSVVFGLNSVKN